MDVIVTAGSISTPADPLFALTHGGHKALLKIAGKPMIQWMLDALSGSKRVDQVVVVGLPEDAAVTCTHPLIMLPNQGDMIANIQAGVAVLDRVHPQEEHCLVASSDVPAVTPLMIDWLVGVVTGQDFDVYYNVIERSLMEKRYPDSRRTYVHVTEGEFCGGDVNALRKKAVMAGSPLTKQIVEARKNPLKQAALVGPGLVFKMLFHRLSLETAVPTICKRLKITGLAVRCPYAEMGMDVDKPFQ
jgi:GTP:adenosylcobinamide-phosphate guanylyltransferase